MPAKLLNNTGKEFIRHIANVASNNALLQGSNGILPNSSETEDKTWKCNVVNILRNNKSITNNSDFAEYIIELYDLYAQVYDVDANIMAAQGYQDSRYRCWYYLNFGAGSSLYNLPMNLVYDIIYNPEKGWLNDDEKDLLIDGLEKPDRASSWIKTKNEKFLNSENIETQKANRSVLHQNMIDNPHLIIKMQSALMSYIALRNNNLCSSSLFAYKMDSELESNNYIQAINKISREYGDSRSDSGIVYTEKIFGYLGDRNNEFVDDLTKETRGYWFAYKIDLNKEDWDSFKANSVSDYSPRRSNRTVSAMNKDLRKGYEGALVKWNNKYNGEYTIALSSVFRTRDHQYRLYLDGKTPLTGRGNDISKHNYFLADALDFNVFNSSGVYLDGIANAEFRPLYREFFGYVNEIVSNTEWGGGFQNQKNDVVHIELQN